MKIQIKKKNINGKIYEQKFITIPSKINMQSGDALVLLDNGEFELVLKEQQINKQEETQQEMTITTASDPKFLALQAEIEEYLRKAKQIPCEGLLPEFINVCPKNDYMARTFSKCFVCAKQHNNYQR